MRLRDGYQTLVTFSLNPALYAEVEVTPPGIDGRGTIDQTTMRNVRWVTKIAKSLADLTEFTMVISWDTGVYGQGTTFIQRNQQFTITFPDGSRLVFWAEVDKFVPGRMVEGERPTATLTVIPTNLNSQCQEAGPIYFPGTGYSCN